MKKEKWPGVSFVVCTYNCKTLIKRCINSILKQEYPGKIEIIVIDGYSTDGTINILKEFGVKILFSKARPEGKKSAKWLGYKNAKNEIIIFIDSDNKLVEKDWVRKMVKPLINNDADFCICRMAVVKSDKPINRYLSLIGTDPFVDYCSIDSLLSLRKLNLIDKGDYYIYNITPKNFIITGGYYFAIKKDTLDRIGGYTQDTDVVYNLAKNNLGKVAIPKKATIHHLISDNIINFTKKKFKWAKIHFKIGWRQRDFEWIVNSFSNKLRVLFRLLENFIFFPKLIIGFKMYLKDKEPAWFLHPIMSWLTAAAYLGAYLKISLKNE